MVFDIWHVLKTMVATATNDNKQGNREKRRRNEETDLNQVMIL